MRRNECFFSSIAASRRAWARAVAPARLVASSAMDRRYARRVRARNIAHGAYETVSRRGVATRPLAGLRLQPYRPRACPRRAPRFAMTDTRPTSPTARRRSDAAGAVVWHGALALAVA